MAIYRPPIDSVFTPRSAVINPEMYIERPALEEELCQAIYGSYHTIIFGDSGVGKSWLFKKVLQDLGASFCTVNCGQAVTADSFTPVLRAIARRGVLKRQTAEIVEKEAGLDAIVAKGGMKHSAQFEAIEQDPLEECFARLRREAGEKGVCTVVFDNIEFVLSSPKLMAQLGSMILLLDDDHFSRYRVKLILVAVPSGIRRYYEKMPHCAPVANRMTEIPEVSRLDERQVGHFVRRGFVDQLQMKLPPDFLAFIQRHVHETTMGVPQRMHEYCMDLAVIFSRKNWAAGPQDLALANLQWLKNSMSRYFSAIDSFGRGDQLYLRILYCLGMVKTDVVRTTDIHARARNEFRDIAPTLSTLKKVLTEFTEGDNPLLTKSSEENGFYVTDHRYVMCIRASLGKVPATREVFQLSRENMSNWLYIRHRFNK